MESALIRSSEMQRAPADRGESSRVAAGKRREGDQSDRPEVLQGADESWMSDNGPTFLVLERQNTLTTSRGMELKAQTDLNKAIADRQRATGKALQVNSVVVKVR